MEILKAQGILKTYRGRPVIKDVSLVLKEGEIACLLGKSGVGKSTLFNVLSGLQKPDSGHVLLNGQDITGKPGFVSYMQQKDNLLPHKKVIDNICLPLIIKGERKEEAREKAYPLLEEFGLLGAENLYPSELSGGMRQRAALLRTFFLKKDVLLLDEPFSSLDAFTKRQMYGFYLEHSKSLSKTALLITHDIDEALLLSDRIYIMDSSPGSISEEIMILEEKEKSESFDMSSSFMEIKKQILTKFHVE